MPGLMRWCDWRCGKRRSDELGRAMRPNLPFVPSEVEGRPRNAKLLGIHACSDGSYQRGHTDNLDFRPSTSLGTNEIGWQ
jgi:hypothetical protein